MLVYRAGVAQGPSGLRKFHLFGRCCCLSTEKQAGLQDTEDKNKGDVQGRLSGVGGNRSRDEFSPGSSDLGEDKGLTTPVEGGRFLQWRR